MDTPQEGYVPSPVEQAPEDCGILSPSLADILSDDRILRFYQCVKDIKTQNSPKQTASMFFALCHALGDTVSFLKVPNMSKIMFRQDQQIFAVNVAGTQQETVQNFQQPQQQDTPVQFDSTTLMHDVDSTHGSNLYSAAATTTDGSPQQLLQAALASVASHVEHQQQSTTEGNKRKVTGTKDGTTKKYKKASPRDKQYAVRRNELIQDLLKVQEPELIHQANMIDDDTKLVVQGLERSTKIGMLQPLERIAAIANMPAHYDCDFAPKNAGVYFNFEYFQLYLAYRDFEAERMQQQTLNNSDTRPVAVQVRTEIEKILTSSNWEAIRRRLSIGERICQVCGVVGRGFLLLSKQVSGRKLLHNFNTTEWAEFMREFANPENQSLLQTLQAKYSPERIYGRHELIAAPPQQQQQNTTTEPNTPVNTAPSTSTELVVANPDTTNYSTPDLNYNQVATSLAAAVEQQQQQQQQQQPDTLAPTE